MLKTDLSSYKTRYNPGPLGMRVGWYFVSILFFKNGWFPVYGFKRFLLRLFGAKLGKGLIIKPYVNIKYPWKLIVGDHCWIGEKVWIDNLDTVTMGNHVCLSQGAFLLTGNHDYTKESFDLITAPIHLEDGVWIGAKAIVCPGVTAHSHAVLGVAQVATKDLEAYMVNGKRREGNY